MLLHLFDDIIHSSLHSIGYYFYTALVFCFCFLSISAFILSESLVSALHILRISNLIKLCCLYKESKWIMIMIYECRSYQSHPYYEILLHLLKTSIDVVVFSKKMIIISSFPFKKQKSFIT